MTRAATVESNEPNPARSRKGARTRARLLDAAKRVFERDGFLAARISDIAGRAGLSHGSFYHYFDSKEEVFREVAERMEAGLTRPPSAGEAAAAKDAPPLERIRAANRRYLERYRAEARIMGVIEEASRYDPLVREARVSRQKHFASRSERFIRSLQRSGLVDRRIDPALASTALGAMVARFAELWLVQGYADYDFDAAVEQLTLLWCNALGLARAPARKVKKPAPRERLPEA